jgi:signal peptidase I
MPLQQILIVYLIGTLLVFLPSYGLSKLFTKVGVPAWKAYVPFYNTWVMQEITKRPKHWVFWQFIPVVGWFITPGIFIEFAKVFNVFSLRQHTLASLVPFAYFPWLASQKSLKFIGPEGVTKHKKPGWREWVDAAIFAVVAATLIRTFIFEAYTIPSGSMEKTLLINDFLFVSKLSYGPRIPNTPLSVPFVHNYLPGSSWKSYSEAIKLPYIRWFATAPKRGDVVVFNFPAGDTVVNRDGYQTLNYYYGLCREKGNGDMAAGRKFILNSDTLPLAIHPPDKTDNYIKRCVAVSGDILEIKGGEVYTNGVKNKFPPHSVMRYIVETNGQNLDPDVMKSEYGVNMDDPMQVGFPGVNMYDMELTADAAERLKATPMIKNMKLELQEKENTDFTKWWQQVFPYDTLHKWTLDYFGPIWIPKKGATLHLTPENYSVYERAIRIYEKNDFTMAGGKFLLDGKEITDYTFKMDYYWMMGDNRHGSQDSRYWGFVPEDRIVGKAWMIWFSWEGGPRWSRLFKMVK